MNWYKKSSTDPKILLNNLRSQMAEAANRAIDGFDWQGTGGGACDEVEIEIAYILGTNGFDVSSGGQDGDDHAYTVARWQMPDGTFQYFEIDIPASVYETGAGYSWKRREGVKVSPNDVYITETVGEAFDDTN
jgi:hypothetical protein